MSMRTHIRHSGQHCPISSRLIRRGETRETLRPRKIARLLGTERRQLEVIRMEVSRLWHKTRPQGNDDSVSDPPIKVQFGAKAVVGQPAWEPETASQC